MVTQLSQASSFKQIFHVESTAAVCCSLLLKDEVIRLILISIPFVDQSN